MADEDMLLKSVQDLSRQIEVMGAEIHGSRGQTA